MSKTYIAAVHIITQSCDHYNKCIQGTLDEIVISVMKDVESDQDQIHIDFLEISKIESSSFYKKLQKQLDKLEES